MQRTISFERIFNLGNYENIKWREEATFDDADMSDAQIDLLRHGLVLNAFMGKALHDASKAELNKAANSEGETITPEDVLRLVMKERGLLEGEPTKIMKVYLYNEEVEEEDGRISEEG